MDMRNESSCICHVLDLDAVRMFGFDMDELVDLYYNCNGGRPRMVSPNCAKVGAISFSLPPSLPPSPLSLISPILLFISLFHFNNMFGYDLGNNNSSVNASSPMERPPYHGDISGGSSKANSSNHYTTDTIVLSIW